MVKGRNGNHPSETSSDNQNRVYIGVPEAPGVVVEGMIKEQQNRISQTQLQELLLKQNSAARTDKHYQANQGHLH